MPFCLGLGFRLRERMRRPLFRGLPVALNLGGFFGGAFPLGAQDTLSFAAAPSRPRRSTAERAARWAACRAISASRSMRRRSAAAARARGFIGTEAGEFCGFGFLFGEPLIQPLKRCFGCLYLIPRARFEFLPVALLMEMLAAVLKARPDLR